MYSMAGILHSYVVLTVISGSTSRSHMIGGLFLFFRVVPASVELDELFPHIPELPYRSRHSHSARKQLSCFAYRGRDVTSVPLFGHELVMQPGMSFPPDGVTGVV